MSSQAGAISPTLEKTGLHSCAENICPHWSPQKSSHHWVFTECQGNELSAEGNNMQNKMASAQFTNAVREQADVWNGGSSINMYEIKEWMTK